MNIHEEVILQLKNTLCNHVGILMIPPPVFTKMGGEVIDYSIKENYIKIGFPILEEYLNPFGNMQGGMIAAAIDNTFGPLSMLIAPLNYTKELTITYKMPIQYALNQIYVIGKLDRRNNRKLFFSAEVKDIHDNILAIATAMHWVVAINS